MEENAENCSLLFFFLTFSSIIFFLPLSFHIHADSFVAISSRDSYPWKIHRFRFVLFAGRESLKLGMNLSGGKMGRREMDKLGNIRDA